MAVVVLGQAVESDGTPGGYGEIPYGAGPYGVAAAVRPAKVVPLGQAEERASAWPLGRVKLRTVAAAVELSTAAAVTARYIVRHLLGQAVEDALAGAVGRRKVRRLRRAAELDEAADMRSVGRRVPPTRLVAAHSPNSTLSATDGGRSRLEARHG